ncbi:hypothetical protein HB364_25865 [Pseudoflavitalea sp. X16]|uniref:hypothetical protein n=1 Tax=Paraflavitalea devenefica TaxID=2716334 RepID=UPI00142126AE|nr:hypothetical protein [Paraflavitalea devenefica]NII28537.1 hypothetical protein [Paraflavitalea devenefica]
MTDINKISQEYTDFIFLGLDHGINSIRDGGGPLVAFVMAKMGDQKSLTRILTERLENAPAEAEKLLKDLNPRPRLALIAYDGYATVKGERNDAIIVRSFDISEEDGLVFAQRYIPKDVGPGIEPYGNAALMGIEPNILRNDKDEPTKAKSKKPWWKF